MFGSEYFWTPAGRGGRSSDSSLGLSSNIWIGNLLTLPIQCINHSLGYRSCPSNHHHHHHNKHYIVGKLKEFFSTCDKIKTFTPVILQHKVKDNIGQNINFDKVLC